MRALIFLVLATHALLCRDLYGNYFAPGAPRLSGSLPESIGNLKALQALCACCS